MTKSRTYQQIVNWIETYITHVKGELAGKPLILERWQINDIIKPIFSNYNKDGTRQYRTVYIEVPRKNAKSTLGAALALYLLLSDGEAGAEIYSAASDRFQAGIIFDIARHMVYQNDALNEVAAVFQHSIVKKGTASFYKAISAEAGTKHGFNSSGLMIDEVHSFKDRELIDVLTTSTGARRQPLTIFFTTAGYDKTSICWEIHEYAIKVRDVIIKDKTFLPVLYSCESDDIFSEKTWRKANPGYGTIVKKEYIKMQANKVKNNPSFENTFRRLHLNQWTASEIKFISDDVWMGCDGAVSLEDCECYAGLDLASRRDTTAFVVAGKDEDGVLHVEPYIFVPEDTVKDRSERMGLKYAEWVKAGVMIQTPGNVVDHKFIKAKILEMVEKYQIKSIAYDRWGATQIIMDLQDEGIEMDGFGQGFASMNAPTKELEKMILLGKVAHGGHPVLRWMCSNIMLKTDPAESIKIDKDKSSEKVDGMVALVMALGEAIRSEPSTTSIYNDEELRPKGALIL